MVAMVLCVYTDLFIERYFRYHAMHAFRAFISEVCGIFTKSGRTGILYEVVGNFLINEIRPSVAFCVWLLALGTLFSRLRLLLQYVSVLLFLWSSNTLWCGYTTSCVSTYQLIDLGLLPFFSLLCIKLL